MGEVSHTRNFFVLEFLIRNISESVGFCVCFPPFNLMKLYILKHVYYHCSTTWICCPHYIYNCNFVRNIILREMLLKLFICIKRETCYVHTIITNILERFLSNIITLNVVNFDLVHEAWINGAKISKCYYDINYACSQKHMYVVQMPIVCIFISKI